MNGEKAENTYFNLYRFPGEERIYAKWNLGTGSCISAHIGEDLDNAVEEMLKEVENIKSCKVMVRTDVFSSGHFMGEKELKPCELEHIVKELNTKNKNNGVGFVVA